MQISTKAWRNYIDRMSQISKKAADEMQAWISKHGFSDDQALLEYAYALSTHYGEAIGALSCQMYEATVAAQGIMIKEAEAAATPDFKEVARAVHGTMKQSANKVPATIGRLVKQVGADTTLKNAERDGAQFAWIPSGDTCAFCLTLASRGWQYMSKKALKNGHAEHIHANCDCQYAIRLDGKSTVEGYDPEALRGKYDSFPGSPKNKIQQWQNEFREVHKDDINARKRELYERNRRISFGKQKAFESARGTINTRKIDKYGYNNLHIDENSKLSEREIRYINQQITEAKNIIGINDCDTVVIISRLPDRLVASYNPVSNVLLINDTMVSDADIIAKQTIFACPNDPRSTFVHEFIHWADANQYRKTVGNISDASPKSEYSIYQRERTKKELQKIGIDGTDISEVRKISEYAEQKYLANDWEEVYTEFRTKQLLEGHLR